MGHSRSEMEAALKSVVIPWLRDQGFKGSFPHFRRLGPDAVDLLTFQFDRHGGGYLIEIARCPPAGIVAYWGKQIPAKAATAWDMHSTRRRRIVHRQTGGTDGWFRYDKRSPGELAKVTLLRLGDEKIWHGLSMSNAPDWEPCP